MSGSGLSHQAMPVKHLKGMKDRFSAIRTASAAVTIQGFRARKATSKHPIRIALTAINRVIGWPHYCRQTERVGTQGFTNKTGPRTCRR